MNSHLGKEAAMAKGEGERSPHWYGEGWDQMSYGVSSSLKTKGWGYRQRGSLMR